MSCTILFSEDPNRSWTTQNVRYSWLVNQVVERLRPDEDALRQLFRVSEEIHFLALDSLRDEDELRWRRATELLNGVATDIVEGRVPRAIEEEERVSLRAQYSELLQLVRDHVAGAS